jgi:energy-coupling factor transporter ATP-binding protein EcfA2
MKIASLTIKNFRAVRYLDIQDLPGAVVLAGPNGCGKSSVLDAIRLLKSGYGQYHANEYQSWFQEFQINIQQLSFEAHRVLQDPTKPLVISSDIALSDSERRFLREHGRELIEAVIWERVTPRGRAPEGRTVVPPTDRRLHGAAVQHTVANMLEALNQELSQPLLRAELQMQPSGEVGSHPSPVLELIFSMYAPKDIGVIDYHSANRSYGREQVGSVNLNVTAGDDRSRQSALYNTQSKYGNVKTEMASAYIREILAEAAGVPKPDHSTLMETLKELFELFFPGKHFLGPRPTADGKLLFTVALDNGMEHDIDELSAGEKEVLLGYLRLRNSAPRNSVILLDEPELHLNPRLIRGLPRFYQKHLGEALNNQIWMITHSDTLLREAVEEPAFAVFHMQPVGVASQVENQAHAISGSEQVERAVMDLVGDLATYSPKARVVLLEGGGESDVDLNILRQLFPDFSERVNLVSAGSKKRVRELHSLLEQAASEGRFRARFFSIVDRDFDGPSPGPIENRFAWDVYHIENYLLDPIYVQGVLEGLELGRAIPTVEETHTALVESARDTIGALTRLRLEQHVNRELVSSIRTGVDPSMANVALALREAAERSSDRILHTLNGSLSFSALQAREQEVRTELKGALDDGTWSRTFRGRDVLKRFVDRQQLGLPYERFRNLIVNRMRMQGHRPAGIESVVSIILSA